MIFVGSTVSDLTGSSNCLFKISGLPLGADGYPGCYAFLLIYSALLRVSYYLALRLSAASASALALSSAALDSSA